MKKELSTLYKIFRFSALKFLTGFIFAVGLFVGAGLAFGALTSNDGSINPPKSLPGDQSYETVYKDALTQSLDSEDQTLIAKSGLGIGYLRKIGKDLNDYLAQIELDISDSIIYNCGGECSVDADCVALKGAGYFCNPNKICMPTP